MPLYPYSCDNCGEFDEVQRITEPAHTKCPKCGGDVRRLIAASTSFSIEGGGVYSPGLKTPTRSEPIKRHRIKIRAEDIEDK